MAHQLVTTSKKFSLTAPDWLKGLLMAIGAPVITLIIQSTNAGSLVFDWKALLTVAISAAGMYLLKNFFTPAQTTITGVPTPGTTTTVVIPPASDIKAGKEPTLSETPKVVMIALIMLIAGSVSAQSFFKPLPKPGHEYSGHLGIAIDSVENTFRPLVGVTAIVSDGTQLAGGVGFGFQHLKFDQPSQTWVMQYSVSGLAFIGSNGSSASVTGGLVVGFLNLFQVGGGYDFTSKKFVLLTGVGINFN